MFQITNKIIELCTYWTRKKVRILLVAFSGLAVCITILKLLEARGQQGFANKLVGSTKTFNILFWIPMFGHPEWFGNNNGTLGTDALKSVNCPVTNCFITHDLDYLADVTDFDVIIFHAPEKIPDLPSQRNLSQLYVFASLEAPTMIQDNLTRYRDFYNLTMTYRLDSDVFWSYEKVLDIKSNEVIAPADKPGWKTPDENFFDESIMETIQKKSKSIAWFASNCEAANRRQDFVKKIQSLIDVDIYGQCGTMECTGSDCDNLLTSTYRFYLAFENSNCKDYITEKFYRALKQYSIPIIFNGVKDVTRFGPPKSFINANDYDTVDDLVKYLKFLIENPKEYVKYFWWKNHYTIQGVANDHYAACGLCMKLNDEKFMSEKHMYNDIESWFTRGICNQTSRIKF